MIVIMYMLFNIKIFRSLSTQCPHGFSMTLGINSDYFPVQPYQAGVCNGDAVCIQRGRY
jgi:hypothetical protein